MASQAPSPQDPSSHPHRAHRPSFQLTEEERSVLLECRRSSMIRGFLLSTASVLVLRWFVNHGRVPMHMQRRRWFYYGMLYVGSFFVGMSSYRQRCFDKIMALDNSHLADQLRQHLEKKDWSECIKSDSDDTGQGGRQKHHHGHRKPYHPPSSSTPAPSPPSPSSHVGGSGGGITTTSGRPYDHRQLDSRPPELQQEPSSDQPDAFSGSGGGTTGTDFQEASSPEQGGQGQWTTPTRTRGRTFDEIREESRRRQLQKNFPRVGRGEEGRKEEVYVEKGDWRPRQETQGAGRPVRRNKYGDIIED